ncbi:glycoside hydrolase family 31 protein [Aplosporella prunicola CBS 121167]|uniref:alpha-glucosidase n=1 Tax=Aplosporella prunicola CBS 121167 TaxID=1176127 RepID=A0A6A6B6R0_9PEZI|nr:glycoside hydrolase family 31 protein [Aplosporella prunicola CBS 121167]KAF2139822.1 glycoside hydrolase family 31 protein [Aplosporella prunicola CBS 121167]
MLLLPLAASFLTLSGFAQAQTSTATATYKPQFTVPASADYGANLIPNILDPEAVDAQTVCPGYTASDVSQNDYGFTALLTLAGEACNVYGNDIETLNLTVAYQNADRLSINISPAVIDASNSSWYVLPDELIPRPTADDDAASTIANNDFDVSWDNEPSFAFTVKRRSTGDVVFSTAGSKLVYEDQFIEFVTAMPENYNVYGLGEHIHNLRLGNNYTATLYAADVGDPIDYNIYGSHPFYLDTRYFSKDNATGNVTLVTDTDGADATAEYESYSHGVFLRNAHGQEVLLRAENITWRTLGGSIDLFFFDGPTQVDVTKQFQFGAVGLPAMQQYFTFGYHQCRWGYANWSMLEELINDFARFEIPLETVWVDIDYMDQYRDWTTDANTFPVPEGQEFMKTLHDKGLHFVPIVDSAIYIPNPDNASDAYATYTRGHEADVFLKNPDGSEYIGSVWPGYTVFPDWHANESVSWWSDEMVRWHGEIPFDGIWIDMSEVSSFCVGSCGSGNLSLNPVHPPFALPGEPGNLVLDYPEGFNLTNATEAAAAASASSSQAAAASSTAASTTQAYLHTTPTPGQRNVNHPPYVINNVQGDLAVHAVSPNATHNDGVQEYDVHNLFGHQILNATYQGLLDVFPGKRPFIIGRSTFAGSGKWAGHWGGDNASKFAYMYFSISQALSFSLFGIPMFGVDTCGFNGNTDEELCSRWMQLSAFFPFYRNHNTLSARAQEPYRWASVAEATKTAMAVRYALLPYLYTLFHAAHTTGSTVMRALAWEFPSEPALAALETQFLLGPSVLVAPVLAPNASSVDAVFPGLSSGTRWFDWYTHAEVAAEPGKNTTLAAPLGHIPVFVRGGSVLPLQAPALTTRDARKSAWDVLIALDNSGAATGSLYLDDGESVSPSETLDVAFAVSGGRLSVSVTDGGFRDGNALGDVLVLGLEGRPAGGVFVQGKEVEDAKVVWDEGAGALRVGGVGEVLGSEAWMGGWVLEWR